MRAIVGGGGGGSCGECEELGDLSGGRCELDKDESASERRADSARAFILRFETAAPPSASSRNREEKKAEHEGKRHI